MQKISASLLNYVLYLQKNFVNYKTSGSTYLLNNARLKGNSSQWYIVEVLLELSKEYYKVAENQA